MALTALTKKALALLRKLARNVTRKRIEYSLSVPTVLAINLL